MEKKALVQGAGGFIGYHLVNRLKEEGFWVRGVDIKYPDFAESQADEFMVLDLRDQNIYKYVYNVDFDEVYALAALMGGAGFVFTGKHDADIIHNNALLNINTVEACLKYGVKKVFFSSSACVYNEYNQEDPTDPICSEDSAYPANPDSVYGWEKLCSEILYLAYRKNYNLDISIARFHNIFGPGTWRGGKEKAPAALCRKVACAKKTDTIEIWGDGKQTRSFLYIDECLDGMRKLMDSGIFYGPVNIGSEEMVTIDKLANYIAEIAGKNITLKHIEGPLGVKGRNSDNKLIYKQLGWRPSLPLIEGLVKTYLWIEEQIKKTNYTEKK